MIDWMKVKNWLEFYGHINSNWERISVNDESFYAEDTMENTFISLFMRGDRELVAIIGMLHPHVSVGGSTGITLYSHENVTWFLEDNLENMYDELMYKAMNEVNG